MQRTSAPAASAPIPELGEAAAYLVLCGPRCRIYQSDGRRNVLLMHGHAMQIILIRMRRQQRAVQAAAAAGGAEAAMARRQALMLLGAGSLFALPTAPAFGELCYCVIHSLVSSPGNCAVKTGLRPPAS
jgi:hypothetical protein